MITLMIIIYFHKTVNTRKGELCPFFSKNFVTVGAQSSIEKKKRISRLLLKNFLRVKWDLIVVSLKFLPFYLFLLCIVHLIWKVLHDKKILGVSVFFSPLRLKSPLFLLILVTDLRNLLVPEAPVTESSFIYNTSTTWWHEGIAAYLGLCCSTNITDSCLSCSISLCNSMIAGIAHPQGFA
jgi:hypothetical protein